MEVNYQFSKMKRKEIDDVNGDFSDFSLSSPARKIRRLDAELPPIIEEEEPEVVPIEFEQPKVEQSFVNNARRGVVIEELPNVPENEERALVVFQTVSSPLVQTPSNFSVSVDSQFISRFKNKVLWADESSPWKSFEDEPTDEENKSGSADKCLAVVPWMPMQLPSVSGGEAFPQTDPMDIEDGSAGVDPRTGSNMNDGLHQWQQQHCMIPQPPPQNVPTPDVWYR